MKILTCASHAGEADKWQKDLRKTFASDEMKQLYDVISTHTYALLERGTGHSPWSRSYPEDPKIEYLSVVRETIDWRDANASDKEVWLTEFGYDSASAEALKNREGSFKNLDWEGVTDLQAAQYLVRSLSLFSEMDLQRAFIYFYNDKDQARTHAAAGLTRNFVPKKSYWAVKHFYQTLGDYRFNKVISKEEGELYIHEYAHGDTPEKKIWMAWLPTGDGQMRTITLPVTPQRTERMPTTDDSAHEVPFVSAGDGQVSIELSESPVYLFLES